MAVAPPFDRLTKLAAQGVNKLTSALSRLINYIKKLINKIKQKTDQLKNRIKCSDPEIIEIKQLLQKVKSSIDKVVQILTTSSTIIIVLNVAAQVAAAALQTSLAIPVPNIPIVAQAIATFNTLIPNILAALKQLSIYLPIVTASLATISFALGPIINKISSICTNETYDVTVTVAEGIVQDLQNDVTNNLNAFPSKFYDTVNVSQQDINDRNDLIEELISRQQDVVTNLLEAPSKVIIGDMMPQTNQGKTGDYFINTTRQIIYGPKISDLDWGTPINY